MASPKAERAKLERRVETLRRKLTVIPRATGVQVSIDHAQHQINFWRMRQALFAWDALYGDPDGRKSADVESRKCTEMAVEWERRKDQSLGKKLLLKLEELEARIAAKEKVADKTKSIATD